MPESSTFAVSRYRGSLRAPWWPDYEAELTHFPKGRHDDQVDSTSQALDWISSRLQEPAFLTFMRLQVEKQQGIGHAGT